MMGLQELPDNSRLWIYQSNRLLSDTEVEEIQSEIDQFVNSWEAHGTRLNAAGSVINSCFIVLAVDESGQVATGCSIDKSVALVKSLQEKFNIDLMDRLNISYVNEAGEIVFAKMAEFQQLVKAGQVNGETIVFNNMVQNLGEFATSWKVPAAQSWHSNLLK